MLDGDMLNKLKEAINDCGIAFKMWLTKKIVKKIKLKVDVTDRARQNKVIVSIARKTIQLLTDMAKNVADLWKV